MQEWIDLAIEGALARLRGIICIWSGFLPDVPEGWAICDGDNGTPDLADKFLLGVEDPLDIGQTGGASLHTHNYTSNLHNHNIATGVGGFLGPGTYKSTYTTWHACTGTTDNGENLPPYYKVAFIMKL